MADEKAKSLHVPVTEKDIHILDEIKARVSATSRSELIRRALKLYCLVEDGHQRGYELKLQKKGERDILIVLI